MVTLDRVGWFWPQKLLAPTVYAAVPGPFVFVRSLFTRQNPTFWPGATSAVRAVFHRE